MAEITALAFRFAWLIIRTPHQLLQTALQQVLDITDEAEQLARLSDWYRNKIGELKFVGVAVRFPSQL